jgi:hypothetical protein
MAACPSMLGRPEDYWNFGKSIGPNKQFFKKVNQIEKIHHGLY